ncbi:MAG TPA: long-chain fatty acid--CoA ligase [Advenella kashmirensis]|uniref:Long-chain fatty acid--CoA ligase n=1 Tax=Advenella kashmirensis TaxID=310575 RepID=A0A356LFB4_9BURK|nr:long-chain fatty acid--CoA ligase [Advenella kashmirensis]
MEPMIVVQDRKTSKAMHQSRARRLAFGLRALGLKPGDTFAIMLRNSEAFLEAIDASRQIGTTYCPINWHFAAAEVGFLLNDSGARVLIVHADFWGRIQAVVPPSMPVLIVGEHAACNGEENAPLSYASWRDGFPESDQYAAAPRGHMAYTSGTTGKPKGVVRHVFPPQIAAERKRAAQQLLQQTFGLVQGCRALLPAPIYHSAPSLFAQNALQMCNTFVLTDRFDPLEVLQLVQAYRIEVLYLVPIMYVRMLKLDQQSRQRYDLSSLQFVASTGAPCAPDIKRAMIEWLGPIVYETYASSEAGLITLLDSHQALAKPGSAGKPAGEAVIRIYDEDGLECAPGVAGYIYVRQPAYADFHYRNNPQARKDIDKEGLISLGDIGYLDEDGFLFVCDRKSDMVISGGVNIYPAEVEHQLLQYEGIADCAVIGIPDAEFGESLLAFVQPQTGQTLGTQEIGCWLQSRMAKFKIPRQFIIDAALPRDDSGKIYKRLLRDKYWAGHSRKV